MQAQNKINILAISGSLRENSSNNAVLNVVAAYLNNKVNFKLFNGLGGLPHFNDSKDPPGEVLEFRNGLRAADGIFICSPEYAFGVPGTLKNALDWTVSSGELVYKPLALITAATGGDKAHAALLLTFTALSANIPEDAKLLISFIRAKMNENGEINDPDTIAAIHKVADALIKTINNAEKS